jgi:hypothetical protein
VVLFAHVVAKKDRSMINYGNKNANRSVVVEVADRQTASMQWLFEK